jgi:hypothetical protein
MFWDSLDLDYPINLLKLFIIRFAIMSVLVHEKRHPDEIFQGKEVTYKILYG